MAKKPSRVAQQAREAKNQAAEVEKQIRRLSTQIAQPKKYLVSHPDIRTQSTLERFRRYFNLDAGVAVPKRKPTRVEMRAQRNRAIAWTMVALFVLAWLIGKLWRTFR